MAAQQRRPQAVAAATFFDLQALKRHKPESSSCKPAAAPARERKRPRFNPLNAPFASFKTQAAAFEFLDKQACCSILRTFACETAATGQREFIVTSAECFWQHYVALPPASRHHYEIIRQGQPCNLFFDLEFCPEANPHINGPLLVELLLSGVQELLHELWGIPWDLNWVLELDSSTPSKFSRHLLIKLPRLAFADACHAGRFARCVLLRLLAKAMHSSRYAGFLVANKEGGTTTFVDMGVYTRNRAFRLYLSSKFGKAAVLRLTHRLGGASRCPKAAFHDALVSVLHQRSEQPTPSTAAGATTGAAAGAASAPQGAGATGSSSSSSSGGSSMRQRLSLLYMSYDGQEQLLQLPEALQQLPMLQLRPLEHVRPGQQQQLPQPAAAAWAAAAAAAHTFHSCSNLGQQPGAASMLLEGPVQPCFGPSPFPLLDGFIAQVCCEGGVQGQVRSWLVQPGSSTMVFNIKGNRFCGNIGRQHKSNGIFFCVDLSAGVYYQKCYDPECKHYRSNCMPLPKDVWQACMPPAQAPGQQQLSSPPQQQDTPLQEQAWGQQGGPYHYQQRQQQQQQRGPRSSAGDAAGDEDDECIRLLLELETQKQQHQPPQQQPQRAQQQQPQQAQQQQVHQQQQQQAQQQQAHHRGQQQLCVPHRQLQQAAACMRPAAEGEAAGAAGAAAAGICGDEDEWCLQLLHSVEQQWAQAMQA